MPAWLHGQEPGRAPAKQWSVVLNVHVIVLVCSRAVAETQRRWPHTYPTLHKRQQQTRFFLYLEVVSAVKRPTAGAVGLPSMGKQSNCPWVQSTQEVIAEHQTSLDTGLSSSAVEQRRQQYGYNELDKEPGKPLWKLVLEQFDDMLVKVGVLHLSW